MLAIQFPAYNFSIRQQEGKEFIFDAIRKKWLRLTPEEWVRQNIIQYLLQVKHYPASLLAIEKEIQLGELKKRCDIVVYKNAEPWMIIECKEMNVPLSEAVFMQAIRYNLANCCPYIVISNGNSNKGWHLQNGSAIEIDELPMWESV